MRTAKSLWQKPILLLHRFLRDIFTCHHTLSIVGLVAPRDFAVAPYKAIHSRVCTKKDAYPHSWNQYAGAWSAVAYRFLSCAAHDKAFSESIHWAGDAPPQSERYNQERELFNFFMAGLATIESLYYGLFAIASMVDAQMFPITTPKDMRSITPERTTCQFKKVFPKESITVALEQVTTAQDFLDWKEIRNILAHRSVPGRIIRLQVGTSAHHRSAALWAKGIQIDKNTTASRRKWLAKAIADLLNATDDFTSRYL